MAFTGIFTLLPGFDGLGFLSAYAWFLGLIISFVAYTLLMRIEREESAEPAMEIAEELQ